MEKRKVTIEVPVPPMPTMEQQEALNKMYDANVCSSAPVVADSSDANPGELPKIPTPPMPSKENQKALNQMFETCVNSSDPVKLS